MFGDIRDRVKEWLSARKANGEHARPTAERGGAEFNPHQYDDVLTEDAEIDPQEPPAWNQRLFF